MSGHMSGHVSGHALVVDSPIALDPVLLAQELEEIIAADQLERNLDWNPRFYEVRRFCFL